MYVKNMIFDEEPDSLIDRLIYPVEFRIEMSVTMTPLQFPGSFDQG